MADKYLPSSELFGNVDGKHAATSPGTAIDGGPRASEGECTPTASNGQAQPSRYARCGCCGMQRGEEGGYRTFLGKVSWICRACCQAIDINRSKP